MSIIQSSVPLNVLKCHLKWKAYDLKKLRGYSAFGHPLNRGNSTWTSATVRKTFLDFFKHQGHDAVPSSSVIAGKDDDSYFVNAGMNQFKPVFLGTIDPKSDLGRMKRCTSSQKCIRVGGKHNDLSDVGRDLYHHTFFEMLGSWSFGDYFKADACEMAWKLLLEGYKLDPDSLYVTYFGGDEGLGLPPDVETRDIWRRLGVLEKRLLPFGMGENFWDMGPTGPCGPCTEIHYDGKGRGDNSALVNQGHPDVIEIWNLVFMQFNRLRSGRLERLPQTHVDTGMGLERMTAVLSGIPGDNYSTDLFQPLIQKVSQECRTFNYKDTDVSDFAFRKVADHIRMLAVAMADGVMPASSGSGLKVRQILRQSLLCQRTLLCAPQGLHVSLLSDVIHSLGDTYPELIDSEEVVRKALYEEEGLFFGHTKTAQLVLSQVVEDLRDEKEIKGPLLQDIEEKKYGDFASWDCLESVVEAMGLSMHESQNLPIPSIDVDEKPSTGTTKQIKGFDGFGECFEKATEFPVTDDSYKYVTIMESPESMFPTGRKKAQQGPTHSQPLE